MSADSSGLVRGAALGDRARIDPSVSKHLASGRIEPRRFRPRLSLGHHQDLIALVKDLAGRSFEARVNCIHQAWPQS